LDGKQASNKIKIPITISSNVRVDGQDRINDHTPSYVCPGDCADQRCEKGVSVEELANGDDKETKDENVTEEVALCIDTPMPMMASSSNKMQSGSHHSVDVLDNGAEHQPNGIMVKSESNLSGGPINAKSMVSSRNELNDDDEAPDSSEVEEVEIVIDLNNLNMRQMQQLHNKSAQKSSMDKVEW
jgi:hypothetical protein